MQLDLRSVLRAARAELENLKTPHAASDAAKLELARRRTLTETCQNATRSRCDPKLDSDSDRAFAH
jgi:hypothetical protein